MTVYVHYTIIIFFIFYIDRKCHCVYKPPTVKNSETEVFSFYIIVMHDHVTKQITTTRVCMYHQTLTRMSLKSTFIFNVERMISIESYTRNFLGYSA